MKKSIYIPAALFLFASCQPVSDKNKEGKVITYSVGKDNEKVTPVDTRENHQYEDSLGMKHTLTDMGYSVDFQGMEVRIAQPKELVVVDSEDEIGRLHSEGFVVQHFAANASTGSLIAIMVKY